MPRDRVAFKDSGEGRVRVNIIPTLHSGMRDAELVREMLFGLERGKDFVVAWEVPNIPRNRTFLRNIGRASDGDILEFAKGEIDKEFSTHLYKTFRELKRKEGISFYAIDLGPHVFNLGNVVLFERFSRSMIRIYKNLVNVYSALTLRESLPSIIEYYRELFQSDEIRAKEISRNIVRLSNNFSVGAIVGACHVRDLDLRGFGSRIDANVIWRLTETDMLVIDHILNLKAVLQAQERVGLGVVAARTFLVEHVRHCYPLDNKMDNMVKIAGSIENIEEGEWIFKELRPLFRFN